MPGLSFPYVKLSYNTSLQGPSLRPEVSIAQDHSDWFKDRQTSQGGFFLFFFCLYQIENWCSLTFVRPHLEGKITTYWLSLIQVTGTTVRHFFKFLFMWLSLCDRSRSSYRPSSHVFPAYKTVHLQLNTLSSSFFVMEVNGIVLSCPDKDFLETLWCIYDSLNDLNNYGQSASDSLGVTSIINQLDIKCP